MNFVRFYDSKRSERYYLFTDHGLNINFSNEHELSVKLSIDRRDIQNNKGL